MDNENAITQPTIQTILEKIGELKTSMDSRFNMLDNRLNRTDSRLDRIESMVLDLRADFRDFRDLVREALPQLESKAS